MKIVELPKPAPGVAHDLCARMFERQAARGEMAAAAFVVIYRDGNVGTEYVSEDRAFPLLGGLAMLESRILKETLGEVG